MLRKARSEYVIPTFGVYFCSELASDYMPVIYDPEGHGSDPEPSAIYYRVVGRTESDEYCIQYFVYWLRQNCGWFPGLRTSHTHDYEPILIFLRKAKDWPYMVVNAGTGAPRFHKTEIRRADLAVRDSAQSSGEFRTSPAPHYPWGGEDGQPFQTEYKKYPLATALHFEKTRPLFGVVQCNHVFTGALPQNPAAEHTRLSIKLRRLTDRVLERWYFRHYTRVEDEPFGHDVGDPFRFPYVKYVDAKPFLDQE